MDAWQPNALAIPNSRAYRIMLESTGQAEPFELGKEEEPVDPTKTLMPSL
jgi:hypothetical protein